MVLCTETNPECLQTNLRTLAQTQPDLVERLEQVEPAPLAWEASRAGPPTASLPAEDGGRPAQLVSKYDPMGEADKLIADVDHGKHACIVVLGMGLGYHVKRIVEGMQDGVLIVFEPDLAVLRAVLERIDHSSWLGKRNIVLADASEDRGSLLGKIDTFSGVITQGAVLVTHPPTRQRHGDQLKKMSAMFTDMLAYCRTNVATALVNSSRTVENLTANIAHYAAGATTNELHNALAGFPAVCVGAGPSLAKNIAVLRDPDVRKNVVVITVQTALKVLLKHGIQPDFVTALDYAEISKRFYEGLPPLPDVTLVAEPKAHCSILDSFPGPVRVDNSGFLDRLLGEVAPEVIPIPDGATVAHLSFYLAQHMGCDPITLIGQDLGFSDGLYYMPGTAIHDVWAPELNEFNSLEMMEWQRVVRHRAHLSKKPDINGRPIYTDEQMLTYLKQFERDFSQTSQRVIDCTEGGLPKHGTTRMPFAQAMSEHATRPLPQWPIPKVSGKRFDHARLIAAAKQLQQRADEARELRQIAARSAPVLRQILEHQRDKQRVEELFKKLQKMQRRIAELNDMFDLINQLNTIGTFNRARRDRRINHQIHDDAYDEQAKRLERDLENVDWLKQACDEAASIFEQALTRVKQSLKDNESQ